MKGEHMNFTRKLATAAGAAGLGLFAALPAWAQEAETPTVDSGVRTAACNAPVGCSPVLRTTKPVAAL